MCKYVLVNDRVYKPDEKIFKVIIEGYFNGDVVKICYFYNEDKFKKIADELKDLMENYTGALAMVDFNYIETKLRVPICDTLKNVDIKCINTDGKTYNVKLEG